MVPDTFLRFDAMIRTLKNTILPAIPVENKAAIEQASLLIASLGVIETQIPFAHAFEVSEVRGLSSLIDVLVEIFERNAVTLPESDRIRIKDALTSALDRAADPMSLTSDLQNDGRIIRAELDMMIELANNSDEQVFTDVAIAVVAFEKGHLARERAWVSATGFDVFPESLPTIENALAKRETTT